MPKIPKYLLLFAFFCTVLVAPAGASDFEVRLKRGTDREKLAECRKGLSLILSRYAPPPFALGWTDIIFDTTY